MRHPVRPNPALQWTATTSVKSARRLLRKTLLPDDGLSLDDEGFHGTQIRTRSIFEFHVEMLDPSIDEPFLLVQW